MSVCDRARFDLIRYGSCWEDADVLLAGLNSRVPGGRVLSIASAGDNVLALLAQEPELIVAVDLSPAQLACLELRMAAFRLLDYEDCLAFLGVSHSENRWGTYQRIRQCMSPAARGFWNSHRQQLENGAIHSGKFERYFSMFRRILPLIHSKRRIEAFLQPKTPAAREQFYTRQWNTRAWRSMARLFFSQQLMGWLGRDPSFFEHVDGSMADHVLRRAEHAATQLDTAANPYLHYILTGSFGETLPLYLREEHFKKIRAGLERIELLKGDLTAPTTQRFGQFDAFNLSDVFEYMAPAEFTACADRLADSARPGARFMYWNLLAPRCLGAVRPTRFVNEAHEARTLHGRDMAFFYSALQLSTAR